MMRYLRSGSLLVLLSAAVAFVFANVAPVQGEAVPDSEKRLLEDIKYLASDELEGRGVGTNGLNKAAEHIRQEFEKAGLDVTHVEGKAYHKFTMVTGTELGSPNSLQFNGPEGKTVSLEIDKDFQVCSFGGTATFDGGIVFGDYAIDASKEKYNSFEGIDVKGKAVIVMRRTPQQGNPHSPFAGPHGGLSRHAELRTKVSNAFSKGATAIIFVNDNFTGSDNLEKAKKLVEKSSAQVVEAAVAFETADPKEADKLAAVRKKLSDSVKRLQKAQKSVDNHNPDPLMTFGYGGNGNKRTTPIFHISQKACNQLLAASLKTDLAKLEAEIDKDLKPQAAVLTGWTAKGTATVDRVETEVKNVIGVLEGEGPLADETIVIGAHYDHVGLGGAGSLAPGSKEVHNGADDNASGTVSLIEMARQFGARKEKLPRRLVFIAFTAEEMGLIGSARYVKEPVFPLDKTIAMFNMDMVGRLKDDKLTVFGIGTAPRWKDQIEKLSKDGNFKTTLKPDGFGPSDQSSFYAKKIPVLHFFTGTHSDYHRPGDDWQKINVNGMSRVIEMIEKVVIATAENPERPKYLEVKSKAKIARGGSRPYFGSIPDFGTNEVGYKITGTAAGSPAAKGGMVGGDLIIQFGKSKIGGLDDFDLALRKFTAGDEVEVTVMRKGKKVKLKIILDKPR